MQGNVMLQGHDIVLIASAPWRVDSRVNCHHVATRLAVDNRVLYVESPGLRPPNLLHGADRRKAIGRVRRWVGGLLSGARRISPNLYVTSPMIVPFYSQDWITRLNGTLFGGACATAARSLGFGAEFAQSPRMDRRTSAWFSFPSNALSISARSPSSRSR